MNNIPRPKSKFSRRRPKLVQDAVAGVEDAQERAGIPFAAPVEIPEAIEIINSRTQGQWHTSEGVAEVTGLPVNMVAAVLKARPDRFEKAAIAGFPVYRVRS